MSSANRALVAIGGNLPFDDRPPVETLRSALAELDRAGLTPIRISSIYATPCFPAGAGPDYVNAAAEIVTGDRSPEQVLAELHRVEALFGRHRSSRWAGRTLDLDLIAFGEQILPDANELRRWIDLPSAEQAQRAPDRLILPHPRMQDRAFVLVPLADVVPDWRHPLTGLTVAAMLTALPELDRAAIVRL
ncbi:2-amino-4-hydroxy-6-hydroxymethyldihydropteridine diphosphokinase [Gemmobacter denitrificans]|uniref:2-amino-4-hydroxy-6-hydroxymethyldihydropteridine pyrophosphokinase n=1 Tax=Gemmobacter denitrificans TaxID=3123040 RepID=A0ABU8BRL2_9RHOB